MAYPSAPSFPVTPGGGAAASAPTLTVGDRLDGAAYTVTAGARVLAISNPDGATLLTTVRKASYGSAITVTNSSGINPSWTAPSGGAEGESLQVRVRATKGGLTSSVAFTERVQSTGLASVAMESVDLTSGWTLYDPDNLVNTVTIDGNGVHTLTWNELASGSQNFNPGSGTTHRFPRWYKLLSISGTQPTTATPIVWNARIEADTSGANAFNQRHVFATSHDPTATAANDLMGVGASWTISSGSSTVQLGVWTRNSTTQTSSANNQRALVSSARGFESIGNPAYIAIRDTDAVTGSGSRDGNQDAIGGSGANLYVIAGFGTSTNSATISAGDVSKFKLSFSAVSFTGI